MKIKKPCIVLPVNKGLTKWSVFAVIRKPTLKLIKEFDSNSEAIDFAKRHNDENNY